MPRPVRSSTIMMQMAGAGRGGVGSGCGQPAGPGSLAGLTTITSVLAKTRPSAWPGRRRPGNSPATPSGRLLGRLKHGGLESG